MRTDLYRVKRTSEGRDACGLAWLRAAILLSRFHITRGSGGSLVGSRDEYLGFTMARAYDSLTFRTEGPCAITSQGGRVPRLAASCFSLSRIGWGMLEPAAAVRSAQRARDGQIR